MHHIMIGTPRQCEGVFFFCFMRFFRSSGIIEPKTQKEEHAPVERLLALSEDTPIRDIMAAYPWLKDEAIRLDDRFKLLDSPLARLLLRKATIRDASRRTGFPASEIIAQINKMVDGHTV